jgi:AcrR family transcriptional regulator
MSRGEERRSRGSRGEPIWTQRPPRARRPRYTREQIADAALRIADAEGFDAVSMRRVASELGAGTMTLYHYVRTKDDLRALMDDAVMGELIIPEGELPDDWRAALTEIAHRSRNAFRRHPWMMGQRGESQSEGGPNGMRHFEQSLAAVAGTGLDLERRLEIIAMVDDYVYGFAMRESGVEEARLLEDVPAAIVEYLEAQLATGDYPHIAEMFGGDDTADAFRRMLAALFDEKRFDRGLDRLMDGIALDIERNR